MQFNRPTHTESINTPQKHKIHELIENIRECVGDLMKESSFLEFIFHPSRFLNLLPDVYRDYPDLKVSKRLRR